MDAEAITVVVVVVIDTRDLNTVSVGPRFLQILLVDGLADLVSRLEFFEQLDRILFHRRLHFRYEVAPFAEASDAFDI